MHRCRFDRLASTRRNAADLVTKANTNPSNCNKRLILDCRYFHASSRRQRNNQVHEITLWATFCFKRGCKLLGSSFDDPRAKSGPSFIRRGASSGVTHRHDQTSFAAFRVTRCGDRPYFKALVTSSFTTRARGTAMSVGTSTAATSTWMESVCSRASPIFAQKPPLSIHLGDEVACWPAPE
jgi:hypothetical protein